MQQLFRICCDHLSASYLSAQLGELLQRLLDSCVSLFVGKSTVVRTHYNAECGGLLAVGYLLALVDIEELYAIRSFHYEVLKGDKAGISSIRVNDQYRIEFTVKQSTSETVVTICNILELSNHYK